MRKLRAHTWPGNIRELRNVVERAMIKSPGPVLHIDLPEQIPAQSAVLALNEIQRRHIVRILEQTAWRVRGNGGAAELLEIKPTTLDARMAKLGIRRKR
jgi:transcriptional regulator of acetoin/glycerol metabolism